MNEKQRDHKIIGNVFLFLGLTASCIVFTVLCLYNTNIIFVQQNALWLSVLTSVLLIALCALALLFIVSRKETLSKTLISVYVFLLFCLVLIFIFQKTGFFTIVNNEESLRQYLETAGAWMPVLYIVLQYLQVVVLPIPSVVSTAAGVALFGPLFTTIYSLIGILAGSITAFFIGRKLGYKAVAWLIGKETLEKWKKKLKGKDNLILTLMFLLPMFPDDVLCFIAGLSTMSNGYFLIMIVVSRVLAITATCFSLELIPFNTWWGLSIWLAFFAIVLAAFIIIYRKLDVIQEKLSSRFKVFRKKNK